jgi:hypothetical protein
MAIIVPAIPITRTEGERKVIISIQKSLSDNWYVYYEPTINGVNPDFVMFSDSYGILLLEVKDYYFNTLKYISPDIWRICTESGEKSVTSPLKQVSEYAYKLLELLSNDSLLVHQKGKFIGRLILPVLYACVFPNLTRSEVEILRINTIIPEHLLFLKDDLEDVHFSKKIESIFKRAFPISKLEESISELIKQKIYPQIKIENKEKYSFPLHSDNILKFPSLVDEILFIATEIRHLHNFEKVPLKDIYVLYAMNNPSYVNNMIIDIISDMGINIQLANVPVIDGIRIAELQHDNINVNITEKIIFLLGLEGHEKVLSKLTTLSPKMVYLTAH